MFHNIMPLIDVDMSEIHINLNYLACYLYSNKNAFHVISCLL